MLLYKIQIFFIFVCFHELHEFQFLELTYWTSQQPLNSYYTIILLDFVANLLRKENAN